MNNKNTIRRDYLIIRRIMRGDHPSASVLLQYLERNDITITLRTLQRDMADIRSNFDIEVSMIVRRTVTTLTKLAVWIWISCYTFSDLLKVLT